MNWYKKSQFTSENTQHVNSPMISVEPYEPIVQEAVDELTSENPNFFSGVNKIKIDMGYGQFGSVSSDNPADININMNNIKNEVGSQLGQSIDANNPEHKEALKQAVKRVIIHEHAHVGDASEAYSNNPEEFMKNPFPKGESVAEQAERNYF